MLRHKIMSSRTGILYLVSGPSGSGKTTLCQQLLAEFDIRFSVSCTTRAPRAGEVDHRDYHFLSHAEFEQRIAQGDFLEHAQVHGNYYGTLQSEVLEHLENGRDVMLDIDVQGAEQVRKLANPLIQKALVDLFVMPATEDELRKRLTGRGTDAPEIIALRLQNSLEEMRHWSDYRYCLRSTTREADYQQFRALLLAERLRVSRMKTL